MTVPISPRPATQPELHETRYRRRLPAELSLIESHLEDCTPDALTALITEWKDEFSRKILTTQNLEPLLQEYIVKLKAILQSNPLATDAHPMVGPLVQWLRGHNQTVTITPAAGVDDIARRVLERQARRRAEQASQSQARVEERAQVDAARAFAANVEQVERDAHTLARDTRAAMEQQDQASQARWQDMQAQIQILNAEDEGLGAELDELEAQREALNRDIQTAFEEDKKVRELLAEVQKQIDKKRKRREKIKKIVTAVTAIGAAAFAAWSLNSLMAAAGSTSTGATVSASNVMSSKGPDYMFKLSTRF